MLGLAFFADAAVETAAAASSAVQTSNTSLMISICTIVIAPTLALIVSKWADGKTSKAKLDAEAVVAQAKLESEAAVAKAKMELDSKLMVLTSQHQECVENHAGMEKKLEQCEEQHRVSAEDRADMNAKIEKFQTFMAEREAREQAVRDKPT